MPANATDARHSQPLSVALHANAQGAVDARLRYADRSAVFSLMEGTAVSELPGKVRRVYSVCAEAQQLATWRAIHSATGRPTRAAPFRSQQARVQLENLREHLLHMAQRWGCLYGGSMAIADFAPLYQQLEAQRRGERPTLPPELRQQIESWAFTMPAAQWLAIDSLDELQAWSAAQQSLAACTVNWVLRHQLASVGGSHIQQLGQQMLPTLGQKLLDRDESMALCRTPTWFGLSLDNSFELGQQTPLLACVAERHGKGLLWRKLQRLSGIAQQLVQAESEMPGCSVELPPGVGAVRTARGWLMHALDFEGETVTHFRALAPTDWNFQTRGVAKTSLENLDPSLAIPLEQQARAVIDALDPCVGYSLALH